MAMANLYNSPITLLKKAVDLNDLKDPNCGEVDFELDNANLCLDGNNIDSTENDDFDKNQVADNICFISDDEGDDDETEYMTEMEQLLKKMKKLKNSDVTPVKDGGVLKQLKKPGIGKTVPQGAMVFVHYNAYTEVGQPPYDSTRLRGEPVRLRLGQGNCIEGLELAILSMAKSEMSRFLIQPDYGYGEMGCPPRIPPKAKLIMDVEVLNFTEQDGVDDYYDLSPEERRTKLKFADIEKVVNAETAEAKQYFDNKNYQKAAVKYSRAQNILEDYHLKDENEQKLWLKQCLRVFLNLAICHHHLRHYGRTIHFSNEVLKKDKNNVKALYFKGKALHGLCSFADAKESLKRARTLEPSNTAIANALQSLTKSMKDHELFEKSMCQKMFSKPLTVISDSTSTEKKEECSKSLQDVERCSREFRNLVEQQLLKFQSDSDMTEMPFPSINMTDVEIACILETAEKLGMDIKKRGTGSHIKYEVHKKSVKPEGSQ